MSAIRPATLAVCALIAASALLGGCSGAAGSGKAVTVVTTDMAFQPREVRVAVDVPASLRLQNKGALLHDWTVERLPARDVEAHASADHAHGDGGGTSAPPPGAVHVAAEAGHTAEVRFTPTAAGEYVFYCTVAGHRQAGMEGKLVVG